MDENKNVIIEYIDGDTNLIEDISKIQYNPTFNLIDFYVDGKLRITVNMQQMKSLWFVTDEELSELENGVE